MNGLEGIRSINARAAEVAASKKLKEAATRKSIASFANAGKPVRNRTVRLQGREVTV